MIQCRIASGYPFPVPWYLIPANILINLKLGYEFVSDERTRQNGKLLRENGIADPSTPLNTYIKDQTFISIGALDTEYPLTVVPDNVVPCGPIYLSSAPVSEQDPELARWLKQAPTILIMLGSHGRYSESKARAMLQALRKVFDTTPCQVLWKFRKESNYTDDFLEIASDEVASGRLRLEEWFIPDPASMLATGDVVLSVNHGGSNCYHEALAYAFFAISFLLAILTRSRHGVPQIALPMWADCFDFAMRAEYRKIGVFGNAKAAPEIDGDELAIAFSRVLGDGEEAKTIKESVARLAEKHRKVPGRSCAAKEIARLARIEAS